MQGSLALDVWSWEGTQAPVLENLCIRREKDDMAGTGILVVGKGAGAVRCRPSSQVQGAGCSFIDRLHVLPLFDQK
jgi:hypothetical protein